jgi:ABC-type antimicrobial peptide transport system permease subunit
VVIPEIESSSRTRWLPWLRWWATLLDSQFRIPGTNIRFGMDPILSLIPGLGDLASPAFTVALLVQAFQQRIPRVVISRMLLNALIDAAIGAVPVAGQVGDIFWRANLRNLALLERHADPARLPERGDYLFLWSVIAALGVITASLVALGIWLVVLLWRALT